MTPADIKALRGGLSQAAFARVYGIPLRSLRDWESGIRNPSGAALSLLRAIAAAPDVMRELLE
jgi:putative transcriptional regulator